MPLVLKAGECTISVLSYGLLMMLCSLKGKFGLGREDFVRQQQADKRVEEAQSVSVFRQRKQESLIQKRVKMDLYKSQLACEQLDSKMVQFLMHLNMVNCYQCLF